MTAPGRLIILGGLAGTGKSSIARELAAQMPAQYLRIDTIESTLRQNRSELEDMRDTGYCVAYDLAEDNLRLGQPVIADSVNPIALTRQAWRDVAARTGSDFVEIEIHCSQPETHRARVEARWREHQGVNVPDWDAVRRRHYEPWEDAALRIDTAESTPAECAGRILAALSGS